MYILLVYENVMSLKCCWFPCFKSVNYIYIGFGICPVCSYYAAEILLNHKFRIKKLYRFSASNKASFHRIL